LTAAVLKVMDATVVVVLGLFGLLTILEDMVYYPLPLMDSILPTNILAMLILLLMDSTSMLDIIFSPWLSS